MLRFTVLALAGVLAITQPVFAEPAASAASDTAPMASAMNDQAAPAASAMPSPPAAPATLIRGKDDNAPVGFGWG